MSVPQENAQVPSQSTTRPSAAYGQPFCRMDFWWSSMPILSRMGLLVAAGVPLDQVETVAQYTWGHLGKNQNEIIRELGSQAMLAGFIRDATDEYRRLFERGVGGRA